jgi:hypothetical protein
MTEGARLRPARPYWRDALLGGGRDLPLTVHLGFLGQSHFRGKTSLPDLLDFLGFPWILSSES